MTVRMALRALYWGYDGRAYGGRAEVAEEATAAVNGTLGLCPRPAVNGLQLLNPSPLSSSMNTNRY